MKLNELPPKTLIKQAHAGVKLINDQYPEAAAILREAITRFDVLREVNQFAKQEAQPITEPKPLGYFSYGSEHGFDWHKTEKEAIESAEAAIDDYRGDACDGWSEETDSICWGVILQQATKVDERPRTDDDRCDPAIDTVCDYALLPAQEKNND